MVDSRGDAHRENKVQTEELPRRVAEDQFYRTLANLQRRRLLYYLLAEEESTVEELATVLSGWEATTTETMQTHADRSAIRLTLIHNHLPQLVEASLVEYDSDDGTVRMVSLHSRVREIIRQSVDAERRTES